MTANTLVRLIPLGSSSDIPVQSMRLDRDIAHPVGRAMLILPAGVSSPSPGESVRLVAVSSGTEQPLMSGQISRVKQSSQGTQITVLEPLSALMIYAPEKAYSATMAGQIIREICADNEVPVSTILLGITVPHMVLGSGQTLLDHCMRLAALSGLVITSDDSGKVGATSLALPIPTGTVDTLRAAIALHDIKDVQSPAKVQITGAGALGAKGPGMTTLPLADPSQIQSGSVEASQRTHVAALRILSDTLTLQMASEQRNAAAISGVLLHTPLPEAVSPGDVVMISDSAGLPTRAARIEALSVTLSVRSGLLARYAFSDIKVA